MDALASQEKDRDLEAKLRTMILGNIMMSPSAAEQRLATRNVERSPPVVTLPLKFHVEEGSANPNHDGGKQQNGKVFRPAQAPRQMHVLQRAPNQALTPQQAQARPLNQKPAYRSAPSNFRSLHRPQAPTLDEYNAQCTFLEHIALEILPHLGMPVEELAAKDAFRGHLEQGCRKAAAVSFPDETSKISLFTFGSVSSGFGMPGSDMDLALMTSLSHPSLPRILEQAILDMGHGARLLTRTRVPIIKVCENPSSELYTALREERKKWDNMTQEEREQYDNPPRHEAPTAQIEASNSAGHISPPTQGLLSESVTHESQGNLDHSLQVLPESVAASATSEACTSADSSLSVPMQLKNAEQVSNQAVATQKSTSLNEAATTGAEQTQVNKLDPAEEAALKLKRLQQRRDKPWYRERRLGPLDFPKTGVGIQCDINFSNPLGLHNTQLLRCYSACDDRVRAMILFVKAWASRRQINSGYMGTLSSYGYVLMVLHYLVNIARPFVCPNLQLARRSQASPTTQDSNSFCDGYDVRFWRNEAEIRSLASKAMITHNRQPLGALLRDFFQYYATQGHGSPNGGFMWTMHVLSLRTPGGLLPKEAKGWTGAMTTTHDKKEVRHRFLFAIEDPFELDHNVARTVTHNGIVAIRDEFRRAWRILCATGRGRPPEGDLLEQMVSLPPPQPNPAEADEKLHDEQTEPQNAETTTFRRVVNDDTTDKSDARSEVPVTEPISDSGLPN